VLSKHYKLHRTLHAKLIAFSYNAPLHNVHNQGRFRSGRHSQSLIKEYSKVLKLNATHKSKQRKIQQNKTTMVQLPLVTVSQYRRWTHSTMFLSPHRAMASNGVKKL